MMLMRMRIMMMTIVIMIIVIIVANKFNASLDPLVLDCLERSLELQAQQGFREVTDRSLDRDDHPLLLDCLGRSLDIRAEQGFREVTDRSLDRDHHDLQHSKGGSCPRSTGLTTEHCRTSSAPRCPDTTFAVDWALKANCLSSYLRRQQQPCVPLDSFGA